MIYNIFPTAAFHISAQIIEVTIEESKFNHFFILYSKSKAHEHEYIKIFERLNFTSYVFVNDKEELYGIIKNREQPIILHSAPYDLMYFLIKNKYKNLSWVCWGSGAKIHFTLKSMLSYLIKLFLYRRFKYIVTLMDEDKISIKKFFGVKKIVTIPYKGKNRIFLEKKYNEISKARKGHLLNKEKKTVVYLGNSGVNMKSYFQMLEELKKFKGKIEILAMLHYGFKKEETYYKLKEMGERYFGDDFSMNEKLYDLEQYPSFMNECDIYICNVKTQTGLGALGACLLFGKKLFLTGNNYSYAKSFGAVVSHISEIEHMDYHLFQKALEQEEVSLNYQAYFYQLKSENGLDWEGLYALLEQEYEN